MPSRLRVLSGSWVHQLPTFSTRRSCRLRGPTAAGHRQVRRGRDRRPDSGRGRLAFGLSLQPHLMSDSADGIRSWLAVSRVHTCMAFLNLTTSPAGNLLTPRLLSRLLLSERLGGVLSSITSGEERGSSGRTIANVGAFVPISQPTHGPLSQLPSRCARERPSSCDDRLSIQPRRPGTRSLPRILPAVFPATSSPWSNGVNARAIILFAAPAARSSLRTSSVAGSTSTPLRIIGLAEG